MLRKTILLLFIMAASLCAQSQGQNMRMRRLFSCFESFAYKDVILLADSILADRGSYANPELTDVYRMKAIAQFSIWDEDSAVRSFRELLKLNKGYRLDEMKTSPKILALFNKTKLEFLSEQVNEEKPVVKDTVRILSPVIRDTTRIYVKEADDNFMRSLAFPGWGHIRKKQDEKGWILAGAAALAAAASVYFIYDCSRKESDYLNEIDRSQISAKYDAYNTAYKIRNVSLLSYAIVWLYAQIDYLGWSPFFVVQSTPAEPVRLSIPDQKRTIMSFRFSF